MESGEPFGKRNPEDHLLELLKGGFGLNDSPALWRDESDDSIQNFQGGRRSVLDPCFYIFHGNKIQGYQGG
eukprot:16440207-Heterocapsa_arctica.AAC.1